MRLKVLSPTINDMILRLFDEASLGNAALFRFLKVLFQCQDIMITSDNTDESAANDIHFKFDQQWFIDQEDIRHNHPDIQINERHPDHFTLTIQPEENLYLKVQFQNQEDIRKALLSEDLNALIPHIQQAILIANQISQQQGDIHSLNYVISHHPCNLLNQPLPPLNSSSSFLYLLSQAKEAANTDINIEVDRDLLVNFFSFTPSETELVKLLFRGLSLEEIAESRCVSKQTIRKQLQSILKKTHCDSQEALMLIIFDALFTGLQKPTNKSVNNIKAPVEYLMD